MLDVQGEDAIRAAFAEAELMTPDKGLAYTYPTLASEALVGIAGEFVEMIAPASESDPAALLLQFLVMAGCALGRSAFYEVEATRHYTNLFGVAVGPTAAGRKGTSWSHVRSVFESAGALPAANIKAGLSSGEGIIHAVRDPVIEMRPVGRDAHEYKPITTDHGVEDKRLLLYAPEFSQALKVAARETNILSEVIRQAWETGDLRILNKNSPEVATGAHIAIVAHISKAELLTLFADSDCANGFANRFLWFCVKRSKELAFGGRVNETRRRAFIERLNLTIERGRNISRVDWAESTRKIWQQVYSELSAPKPGLLGAILSRAEAQTARLSTLCAVLRGSAEIDPNDLTGALAVWDYCEQSARFIFGDRLGHPIADRILEVLRETANGLTRTEISALFKRNLAEAPITAALNLLSQEQLAEMVEEPTAGRSAERWKAIRPNSGSTK
jgi:hypothetical protein